MTSHDSAQVWVPAWASVSSRLLWVLFIILFKTASVWEHQFSVCSLFLQRQYSETLIKKNSVCRRQQIKMYYCCYHFYNYYINVGKQIMLFVFKAGKYGLPSESRLNTFSYLPPLKLNVYLSLCLSWLITQCLLYVVGRILKLLSANVYVLRLYMYWILWWVNLVCIDLL